MFAERVIKRLELNTDATFHRWNIPSFIHLFCITYTFVTYTFVTCILKYTIVMQSLTVVICLLLHEGVIYKRRPHEWGRG